MDTRKDENVKNTFVVEGKGTRTYRGAHNSNVRRVVHFTLLFTRETSLGLGV